MQSKVSTESLLCFSSWRKAVLCRPGNACRHAHVSSRKTSVILSWYLIKKWSCWTISRKYLPMSNFKNILLSVQLCVTCLSIGRRTEWDTDFGERSAGYNKWHIRNCANILIWVNGRVVIGPSAILLQLRTRLYRLRDFQTERKQYLNHIWNHKTTRLLFIKTVQSNEICCLTPLLIKSKCSPSRTLWRPNTN